MSASPLLEVRNLTVHFPPGAKLFVRAAGSVRAVDGVSFQVEEGETLAIIGESGCGKTTLGRAVLRLIKPCSGTISFRGRDITRISQRSLRPLRREMQMVFQDSHASLNPRMTVKELVGEAFIIHKLCDGLALTRKIEELLDLCGIDGDMLERHPHELSGGQRQRIGIARALAVSPRLIVADEPVSSLDVSVQAQILNLLLDLQRTLKLAYIFVSHDLRVVENVADVVAVMYLGKFVEIGRAGSLFDNPLHPYLRALLDAVPKPDPRWRGGVRLLEGDTPSPMHPPSGCAFHPRCPHAKDECARYTPTFRQVSESHNVACFLI